MENLFSISKTAKIVGVTAETLRHWDRIGLVKPSFTDKQNGYRYYSEQEIVKLNTVVSLKCMDMQLSEIKRILECKELEEIIDSLKKAEQEADRRIAELNKARNKIERARIHYENKLESKDSDEIFIQYFPERVIMLSDSLEEPSLDILWDYHRHFYGQLESDEKEAFSFEDVAGIYEDDERSRLFAICDKFIDRNDIKILPSGDYICINCTEYTREEAIERVKREFGITPGFVVSIVIITGILQWEYQVQILLDKKR